jgi:hypothetical protein
VAQSGRARAQQIPVMPKQNVKNHCNKKKMEISVFHNLVKPLKEIFSPLKKSTYF